MTGDLSDQSLIDQSLVTITTLILELNFKAFCLIRYNIQLRYTMPLALDLWFPFVAHISTDRMFGKWSNVGERWACLTDWMDMKFWKFQNIWRFKPNNLKKIYAESGQKDGHFHSYIYDASYDWRQMKMQNEKIRHWQQWFYFYKQSKLQIARL